MANFDRPLIERFLAIGHVDSVQNQFPPHAGRPHRAPAVAPGTRHRLSGVRPARLRFAHGHFDRDTTFHEVDWRSGAENLGYYEELFSPGRFEEHLGNVDPLRPIAGRVHMDLPTLALRTAIDTPGVTAVIAGSRKEAHARSNADAGTVHLDAAALRDIGDILRAPPSRRSRPRRPSRLAGAELSLPRVTSRSVGL